MTESLTFEELLDKHGISHYGVLGMKWGVRKDRRTGKRVGKPVKGTKAARRDQPSVSPTSSNTKALTNIPTSELQDRVSRIRLENEYKKLTASTPAQKSAIRRETENLLANVARREVERITTSVVRSQTDKFLKKHGINPMIKKKKK